ncbi:c-type cytochrome [Candidatus Leptofilum sp.]|uniref:c-type cytochrome n=1 Tax=Candidatus Leptofilum sp. TaxID=3241576 RepID=UPI003B5AE732
MKRVQKRHQEIMQKKQRQQRMMGGLLLVGLLMIVAGVFWLRPSSDSAETAGMSNRQFVAMGEEVYNSYCAACHGFNFEGQPDWQQPFADGSFKAPPHDETGHTWHHSDTYLIESIKLGGARLAPNIGVSAMPAYEDVLTDEQIEAVLAYIKSSWPPEILEAQSAR